MKAPNRHVFAADRWFCLFCKASTIGTICKNVAINVRWYWKDKHLRSFDEDRWRHHSIFLVEIALSWHLWSFATSLLMHTFQIPSFSLRCLLSFMADLFARTIWNSVTFGLKRISVIIAAPHNNIIGRFYRKAWNTNLLWFLAIQPVTWISLRFISAVRLIRIRLSSRNVDECELHSMN